MATLKSLIESAIVADFEKDTLIAQYNPRVHDYAGQKSGGDAPTGEEAPATITVTVNDGTEEFGTGIKKMPVAVEIRANGAADNFSGTLLDQLEEAVIARLQPSYPLVDPNNKPVPGREKVFSGDKHKVFGITAEPGGRSNVGLERIRTVNRVFVATAT